MVEYLWLARHEIPHPQPLTKNSYVRRKLVGLPSNERSIQDGVRMFHLSPKYTGLSQFYVVNTDYLENWGSLGEEVVLLLHPETSSGRAVVRDMRCEEKFVNVFMRWAIGANVRGGV